MSYPYFFIDGPKREKGEKIVIEGGDNNHLKNVLRVEKGDTVVLSGGGHIYECRLEIIGKKKSVLIVFKVTKVKIRPYNITLFQSVLKKNPMELVIQKTTEIGIDTIIPVFTDRVVIDSKKVTSKIPRWQEIAHQASKQSKRSHIPAIKEPIAFDDIHIMDFDIFFAPVEDQRGDTMNYEKISDMLRDKSVKNLAYIIGPEGGFSDKEIELLSRQGISLLNFGSNILRAETAAVYFLSVLDYLLKTRD